MGWGRAWCCVAPIAFTFTLPGATSAVFQLLMVWWTPTDLPPRPPAYLMPAWLVCFPSLPTFPLVPHPTPPPFPDFCYLPTTTAMPAPCPTLPCLPHCDTFAQPACSLLLPSHLPTMPAPTPYPAPHPFFWWCVCILWQNSRDGRIILLSLPPALALCGVVVVTLWVGSVFC